jgi:adenosylcobinamide-GDP ribazoletransferase
MSDEERYPADVATIIGDLRASLAFLTRLPAGWLGVPGDERPDFRRAAALFPVAGCLVGVAGGAVLVVVSGFGVPPLAAAALTVIATMMLTGGLHEDGLADMADCLGGATPERRLAILDDSRIGTYGAAALVLTLLLRVSCLAAITGHGAWRAAAMLVLAEGVSRAAMVHMWYALPPARASGTAHDTGPPTVAAMTAALVIAGVLALLAIPVAGFGAALLAAVFAALTAYMVERLSVRAIGGRVGDTLGACQQLVLAAYLIGAATL